MAVGREGQKSHHLRPPYLMLVTDTSTGEPLFLARVADAATG